MTTASDCCGVVSDSAAASDGVWAGCDNRFRNGGGIDLGCSFRREEGLDGVRAIVQLICLPMFAINISNM